MSDRITVTVAVPIEEHHAERIRSVDPRIEVRADSELQPILRGEPTPEAVNEVKRRLAGTNVLVAIGLMHRAFVDDAADLQWFHSYGAGLDTFVNTGGLELPITVTNSKGVAAGPIAEWAVGAIVLLAKGFANNVRNQDQHRWKRWQTLVLRDRTVGIVGLGAIGEAIASRLRPFGMRIIGTKRSAKPGDTHPLCDVVLPQSELPRLLEESDFVVLAVPLTSDTRHLIDATALSQMRNDGYLVNVARGEVVDQDALLAALQKGDIAGAALDVTDPEPLPPDNPLWDAPNVFISPHMSAIHPGYTDDAIEFFAENLGRFLRGESLLNVVTAERGY